MDWLSGKPWASVTSEGLLILERTGSPICDVMQSILFIWCMCEWGGQRRFTLSLNINCNIEELAFPVPRRPSTYMESLSFYVQWVPEPATAGGVWRKWQDLNLLGALEYIQVKGIMSPSSHSSYAQKLGVLLLACILTHPFATFCYSFQIQQHILDNHSRMPQPKLNP